MKTVKVSVYASVSGSGWFFAITNGNCDSIILHHGRSAEECKDFGNKLLNRTLLWTGDDKDGLGYFSTEVTVTRGAFVGVEA